ncbi:cysteine peptidase family C39 domain-containing protein [Sphingosinicella sp. CPCC 101087]|uniref:cysteine peptidase family C39 domain-containing protein n=1 Tax=Sphingosinicella sp. CPCC 101087 TaxID=2497754 RepID=UPI00101C80DD|nr:cysteine peptidase family C39 domain-containing protein [Sphingosinicella sp. CPCC 101087]
MGIVSELIPVADHANSGLLAFATLLAVHRISVDVGQLRHELGHSRAVGPDDMLRLARRQPEVRTKVVLTERSGQARLPLPALANGTCGWFLAGGVGENEVLAAQREAHTDRRSRYVYSPAVGGERYGRVIPIGHEAAAPGSPEARERLLRLCATRPSRVERETENRAAVP